MTKLVFQVVQHPLPPGDVRRPPRLRVRAEHGRPRRLLLRLAAPRPVRRHRPPHQPRPAQAAFPAPLRPPQLVLPAGVGPLPRPLGPPHRQLPRQVLLLPEGVLPAGGNTQEGSYSRPVHPVEHVAGEHPAAVLDLVERADAGLGVRHRVPHHERLRKRRLRAAAPDAEAEEVGGQ